MLSTPARNQKHRQFALIFASLLVILLSFSPPLRAAETEDTPSAIRYEMLYEGEFLDTDFKLISGVFNLGFKLYPTAKSKKKLWGEKHFVSVTQGQYTVTLGAQNSVPESLIGKNVYLAVELAGKEVFRQPFSAALTGAEVSVRSSPRAGLCESCADAETLAGRPARDYATTTVITRLETRIGALENAKPTKATQEEEEPTSNKKSNVSERDTWSSPSVGGRGGSKDYNLKCPKGYVMTGISGRHGAVLDSIEILCGKLQ